MEVEISYYEESSWRRYFTVDLAELYRSVRRVLRLRDEIARTFEGKNMADLIVNNVYREMLFGGFKAIEDRAFSENALARFYSECFGLKIREDINRIISRMREGMPLERACEDVSCTVEEVPFISMLREISTRLKTIYRILEGIVEPPKGEEIEISDSMIGVNVVRDFLNACKRLLPLYNPMSFFIMSVYSVPLFYLREEYPRILEEEVQTLLKRFGINLTTLIEPDIPDERLREERRIIGLEKNCVGCLIRDVLLYLYQVFQQENLKRFFEIDDEFMVYLRNYTQHVKESLVIERFDHIIKTIKRHSTSYYDKIKKRCEISELKAYTSNSYYRGKVIGGSVEIDDRRVNYTEFFAFLAPLMFSGLAYIEPVSEREFEWTCILGWE